MEHIKIWSIDAFSLLFRKKNIYEKRHTQKSKIKNLETKKVANTAIDHTVINQISLDSFRNDFAKMYIAFTNLTKSIDKFTAQLQLNDERRQKEHKELQIIE